MQNGMPAVSGGALVQLPRAELPLSVRGCVCSLNGAKGWCDSRLVKPSRTPFGYRDFIVYLCLDMVRRLSQCYLICIWLWRNVEFGRQLCLVLLGRHVGPLVRKNNTE